MQIKEAVALRKRWGNQPCNHPVLDKEYDLGISTGDYVCTTCGRAGWGSDWNAREHESKKNTDTIN